jgi:hypothetical protein
MPGQYPHNPVENWKIRFCGYLHSWVLRIQVLHGVSIGTIVFVQLCSQLFRHLQEWRVPKWQNMPSQFL